ncbi:pre-mRNA 3'-end-processing factor FIP1 isoform X2 [Danaus plexippus]|uniref:Uncharacterized protein n=1 Tax=Danaus plexippus plexippus TaxID=278856 RepID=A0A212ENN8_DANPL|nr:pre-mRNA 3'-end-processing factor FIP1 isoform X2 [Danaus plexippus]OWR43112.1 hypothetical protein KGM_208703 [Danaus plexippus plexippus]
MADAAVETAPADENDDNWLYGESASEQIEAEASTTDEKTQEQENANKERIDDDGKVQEETETNEGNNEDSHFNDEHFGEVDRDDQDQTNGDADSQDNGDTDSDDSDDVKVTIGEIKSGPQAYASLNIKRGVGLVAAGTEKPRQGPAAGNKVTLEDLDGPGSINGVPALEFNIDTIEDKPWNKPGADISDYFNYGFNEVTWSAYCERQRRMRVSEAGVALHAAPPPRAAPTDRRQQGPPRHDDMPPGMPNNYQSRENTIQVMTAERREYGRGQVREAAPPADYFSAPPPDHYYQPPPHAPHAPHLPPHQHTPHSYEEPWAHPEQTGWAPSDIKELTPGPMGPPMPLGMPPVHMPAPYPTYRSHVTHTHERDRDRERERDRDRDRDRDRTRDDRDRRDRDRRDEEERDRDRERSRSIKPERIREKSYRRERSRSRSRRHKSRSRSPRQRERSRDRERSMKPKNKDAKEKDEDK